MNITRRRALLVGIVALAVTVPAVAFAATSVFDDVPDNSVYVNDINWLAASGVTKGCNPPTNTRFCPGSNVTREQMAAFMHRLAVNRVVDAGTVEGLTAAQLRGQTGEPGPAGVDGAPGPQGETGQQGDPGPQGETGAEGPQGVQGPQGTSTVIKGSLPNWLPGNIPASPSAGDAWILESASGAPNRIYDNSAAEAGDGMIFGGQAWFNGGPLRGPEGLQGPQGEQGDTGDEGPEGPTGPAGPSPTPPHPASGGWAGTATGPGTEVVLTIPSGVVVNQLRFETNSYSGTQMCDFVVRVDGEPILNYHLGRSVQPVAEAEFDVGVQSSAGMTVEAVFGVYAAECEGSVTWTGYDSSSFVAAHAFSTVESGQYEQTFVEAKVPAGTVIGTIGNYIADGENNQCEIRVRQGSTAVLRARWIGWEERPKLINLGAGILADSDTWIGVRSTTAAGGGDGCTVPAYWTTIDVGVWRPPGG